MYVVEQKMIRKWAPIHPKKMLCILKLQLELFNVGNDGGNKKLHPFIIFLENGAFQIKKRTFCKKNEVKIALTFCTSSSSGN